MTDESYPHIPNRLRNDSLQALTDYCQDHIDSMRGWENSVGYTCDELGCSICNADDALDAARYWLRAIEAGEAEMPNDVADVVSQAKQPIRLP